MYLLDTGIKKFLAEDWISFFKSENCENANEKSANKKLLVYYKHFNIF